MKKINLRELYPDVYTTDFFVDVTEEVMETIRAAERVLYYRTRIKDANGKLVAISVSYTHLRELLTTKANVDRVLKMEVEQDVEKEKDHGQR